jgi:hypothetical protein
MYIIQHCFIDRLSDYTVPKDAWIAPRILAALALAVGRSNYSARPRPKSYKSYANSVCWKKLPFVIPHSVLSGNFGVYISDLMS